MTIDTAALLQHLQNVDLTSAAIGAAVARTLEAAAVQTVKRLPGMIVSTLKKRVQALAAAGKIDAPTMKLLKAYARATFEWVDEQLPDSPGPEKMDAALAQLAAVPYLGLIVRADRNGAREVLQAAYNAIDAEAKAEKAALGDAPDAAKASATPPAAAAPAAQPQP